VTIRDLIEKLTDTYLDKIIDVAAWRRKKKLPDTEKAYFRGYICTKDSQNFNERTPNIPIPDGGATIRSLIEKFTYEDLERDIDVAKWREEKKKRITSTEKAYFSFFIQKKSGKNYNLLASVQIPDKNNQVDSSSKDNMNSKKETGLYIPTKEDFEKAYRKLEKTHKQEVPIDEVLDIVEANLTEKGRMLHENWRSITEQNIATWSREGD